MFFSGLANICSTSSSHAMSFFPSHMLHLTLSTVIWASLTSQSSATVTLPSQCHFLSHTTLTLPTVARTVHAVTSLPHTFPMSPLSPLRSHHSNLLPQPFTFFRSRRNNVMKKV
jgi:hypothetical protein